MNDEDTNNIEYYIHGKGFDVLCRPLQIDMTDFLNRKMGDLGETLLHYYARSDNEANDRKVCDLLLQNGADVNSIDNTEKMPLHRAVIARKFDITELLLNYGAYVNAQDANKNTPLHIASTLDLQLCDLLLMCGADPNIKNHFHETPVFRAVQGVNNDLSECKKILKLLLHYGGDVLVRDLNQQNAIEVASRLADADVFNWCKQNVQNSAGEELIPVKFRIFLLSNFKVCFTKNASMKGLS